MKLTVRAAMRARDVSRPQAEHLAEADDAGHLAEDAGHLAEDAGHLAEDAGHLAEADDAELAVEAQAVRADAVRADAVTPEARQATPKGRQRPHRARRR